MQQIKCPKCLTVIPFSLFASAIAGGYNTLKKYGKSHFSEIGKIGGSAGKGKKKPRAPK